MYFRGEGGLGKEFLVGWFFSGELEGAFWSGNLDNFFVGLVEIMFK